MEKNQSYHVVDDEELPEKFRKPFTDRYLDKENKDKIRGWNWDELLNLATPEQIDWITEEIYKDCGGDFLWKPETVKKFDEKVDRNYQPIKVFVNIKIYKLDFPDTNKDEMRLNVIFFSSAKRGDLINAIKKEILPQQIGKLKEMKSLLETEEGCNVLDKVHWDWLKKWLQVKVSEECSEPKDVESFFCLDEEKGETYLCLVREAFIRIKAPLNFNDYPFDKNELNFLLISSYGKDTTEITLLPDPESDEVISIGRGVEPRGLDVNVHRHCKTYVLDEGPGITRSPVLQFGFCLKRKPWAVILRTILPAIVIMLAGVVFAIWSLLTQGRADSVAIHVIPGVLIAIVALQITAAQGIPAHSSATLLDKFFVLMYIHVLFLLLALIADFGVVITWGLFTVSIGFLLTGIWLISREKISSTLNRIFHKSDKKNCGKTNPAIEH